MFVELYGLLREDSLPCRWVWDALDKSLQRTGKPFDLLGMYKQICARGGFVSRENARGRIKVRMVQVEHNSLTPRVESAHVSTV